MRIVKVVIVLIGWLTLAAHGCVFMSAKATQAPGKFLPQMAKSASPEMSWNFRGDLSPRSTRTSG
jgi:hypothetical protein